MDLGKQALIVKSGLAARVLPLLFLGSTMASVYSTAIAAPYAKAGVSPTLSVFDTALFNLLRNQKNVIDGKNYFDKEFSTSFDRLLRNAPGVSDERKLAALRKCLLSGPASKPDFISANGKRYFYYEVCQAHACDSTRMGLLYDVESKAMRAELMIDGAVGYLGNPSVAEVDMLHQLRTKE